MVNPILFYCVFPYGPRPVAVTGGADRFGRRPKRNNQPANFFHCQGRAE